MSAVYDDGQTRPGQASQGQARQEARQEDGSARQARQEPRQEDGSARQDLLASQGQGRQEEGLRQEDQEDQGRKVCCCARDVIRKLRRWLLVSFRALLCSTSPPLEAALVVLFGVWFLCCLVPFFFFPFLFPSLVVSVPMALLFCFL